jgi:hypothetical protein
MAWLGAVSPGGLRRVIASRGFIAGAAALVATACAGCGILLGIEPLDAGPLDAGSLEAGSLEAGPFDGTVDGGTVEGAAAQGDAAPDADATMQDDAADCGSCTPSDATIGIPEVGPAYDGPLPAPGWIADAGALYHAAGFSQQLHAIYAANDGRVWYFYVGDDQTQIKTVASADLINWAPTNDAISLGVASVGSEGNNFSVGYANIGGKDVVHIVVTDPGVSVVHVRTTIDGGHLTQPSVTTVVQSAQSCTMDSPFTLVTSAGEIFDVTGAALTGTSTCGMDIFQAAATDDGGMSWKPSFPTENGHYRTHPAGADSHELVLLGAGDVLGAYANGAAAPPQDSIYGSVSWARTSGGQWQGTALAPAIFGELDEAGVGSPPQGGNDWSLCALSDGNVHAVRHIIDADAAAYAKANEFQQAVYGDGGTWQSESPPSASECGVNEGLVLVSDKHYDHGMLAAVVGTDTLTVNVSRWDPVLGTWSPWQRATEEAMHSKQFLSGTGCASERPMIFWVEPIYQSTTASVVSIIHGLDVSRFLAPDGGN